MQYNKFTIKTTPKAEDILSAELAEIGVDGVEIEDAGIPSEIEESAIFYDELPENNIDSDTAYVSFYLEASKDKNAILSEVHELIKRLAEFTDIGDGGISVSQTEDKDWINNWKEFFHQFTIEFEDGKKAHFTPSWEKSDSNENFDWAINIDPGTAFGTGAHHTTRLCIKALEKYVKKGDTLLDIGTGSGILSLMAFKFGASRAIGTDLDEGAKSAVWDNFNANGLSNANFELILGNILDDATVQKHVGDSYDIVAANILPDVLEPLTPMVPSLLKNGGYYITSGIIDDKADYVRSFIEKSGLVILERHDDGEWVSFVAQKQ
ncbi:MAG: 50S ribosomal protein L11 methyltransferase [Lachnospiraceae bacterium]|nr:50S ribosomal protein L11 methyltransferase [Lachnospiraceae bacterium]